MKRIIRSPLAQDDALSIWAYIAADSPRSADRLIDKIDAALNVISQYPGVGRDRADIRPGMRTHVVGAYVILYRELETAVEVVRILHGARDIPNLL